MKNKLETKLTKENNKFRKFFRAVARLTANHHVLNDTAVIYACDLGDLLEKIDPEWSRKVPPETGPVDAGKMSHDRVQRSKARVFKTHGTAGFKS